MMRYFLFIFAVSVFTFACKSDTQKTTPETNETTTPAVVNKYTLTPFTKSPAFLDAKMTSMDYKSGKFTFGVEGEQYKLGEQTSDAAQKMCANSDKGQHIHLIVNNKPYAAKYVNEFDYEIEDGEHHVLAFLSRSYHESIKTAAAHQLKMVSIKDKTITADRDITAPMLFYSRPKGTYKGKAATTKVMLDFYTANAPVGSKYQVKANINGEDHMISTWQPYYIQGLPMGKNTITLSLVDMKGALVDTPLNPVTREFMLEADPLENEG